MDKLDFLCDRLPARVEGYESTNCSVEESGITGSTDGFDGRKRFESPVKHGDQINIEVFREAVAALTFRGSS